MYVVDVSVVGTPGYRELSALSPSSSKLYIDAPLEYIDEALEYIDEESLKYEDGCASREYDDEALD